MHLPRVQAMFNTPRGALSPNPSPAKRERGAIHRQIRDDSPSHGNGKPAYLSAGFQWGLVIQ